MRNEAAVWQKLKQSLPIGIWAKRIEDSSGDLGMWDTILMAGGRSAWIELKHTATVRRVPKLRPGQMAFGLGLEQRDIPGFYLCGSSDGMVRILSRDYNGLDWKEALIETWNGMPDTSISGLMKELRLDIG
jgi:hypothetical protein